MRNSIRPVVSSKSVYFSYNSSLEPLSIFTYVSGQVFFSHAEMNLLTKVEVSTRSEAIYLAHRNHLKTASVAARTVIKFNLQEQTIAVVK